MNQIFLLLLHLILSKGIIPTIYISLTKDIIHPSKVLHKRDSLNEGLMWDILDMDTSTGKGHPTNTKPSKLLF